MLANPTSKKPRKPLLAPTLTKIRKFSIKKWWEGIWKNLCKDSLHKRIVKCVIATTLCVIVALLPHMREKFGPAAYLSAMVSVFGHPGRRLGGLLEALGLAILGICIGIAWASLGAYVAGLAREDGWIEAAMAIRALFLLVALMIHGYLRSTTPKLFLLVLMMVIPALLGLTSPVPSLNISFVTQFLYPMLTAIGILFLVNVLIFPDIGSDHLGVITVEGLQEIQSLLNDAAYLFTDPNSSINASRPILDDLSHGNPEKRKDIKLAELTAAKSTLRSKVAAAKALYKECAWDFTISCIAPKELKHITGKGMNRMTQNVSALIGACESKFALMGTRGDEDEYEVDTEKLVEEEKEEENDEEGEAKREERIEAEGEHGEAVDEALKRMKPMREIEHGDERLLRHLLKRTAPPLMKLRHTVDRSLDVVCICVGYSYDVPRLLTKQIQEGSSTVRRPKGVLLQELDIHIDVLDAAINEFAETSLDALETATIFKEMGEDFEVDTLPRDEVFLVSSFMLNLRSAATQAYEMLVDARKLVELRQEAHDKKRVHWPDVTLKKWLSTGKEEEEECSPGAKELKKSQRDVEDDQDDEDDDEDEGFAWRNSLIRDPNNVGWTGPTRTHTARRRAIREQKRREAARRAAKKTSWVLKVRVGLADVLDWMRYSDDFLYALKFSFGMMLLTWPAWIESYTQWYNQARGVWVAFIYMLVFENAVGATIWIWFLRAVGTLLGSAWGYAAWVAGNGNEYVIAVIIFFGLIPSFYVNLGTPYVKAGMVSAISMCVVALSTHLQTVPGSSFDNFYKRTAASLIGGCVALLVQIVLYPVKARVELKKSLATAILQINNMESCVALGVDEAQTHMLKHPRFLKRFERARRKADAAISAAESYLEYTKQEPRLKGNFESHRRVYKEIMFVLRQIVDRMDNLLRLRMAYGSAVLEEFNVRVHSYRRNVAAAITLTLYAVHQALLLKLPLPHFLPSARLAHIRMVVRVRQILHEEAKSSKAADDSPEQEEGSNLSNSNVATPPLASRPLRLKILSWNASSAALEECVEYVEELIELTKMLVGSTEFRVNIMRRPRYEDYLAGIEGARSRSRSGDRGGEAASDEATVGTNSQMSPPQQGETGGSPGAGGGNGEDLEIQPIRTVAPRGRTHSGMSGASAGTKSSRLSKGSKHRKKNEKEKEGEEEPGELSRPIVHEMRETGLPTPLIRIQSRKEAVRAKRKKD